MKLICQKNDYWLLEIFTWNCTIVYKSFMIDRNILNYTTVGKSFELNSNTCISYNCVQTND